MLSNAKHFLRMLYFRADISIRKKKIKRNWVLFILSMILLITLVLLYFLGRKTKMYPLYYSIPKEYEIMKRWKEIKEYPDIPKVIHQIWIGDLERAHCQWMDSFRIDFIRENPDWTYKIWNREIYEEKYGTMILEEMYEAEELIAAQADILRYEILWREGGIYMDADSIWLNRPFDHLIQLGKPSGMFVVYHYEDGPEQGDEALLLNGIIGVTKCHPVMEHIIRSLQLLHPYLLHRPYTPPWQRTGPGFFTAALRGFPVTKIKSEVFAPGSWFFELNRLNLLAQIEKRMNEMKTKYPDALTFQVGASTHSYDSSFGMNCKAWKKEIQRIMANARVSDNSAIDTGNELKCGQFQYSNLSLNVYPPP